VAVSLRSAAARSRISASISVDPSRQRPARLTPSIA
jgi:hypothetical protein